jgi:spore coat protein GerQ
MNGNFYQNPTFPNSQLDNNYQSPPSNVSSMSSPNDYNEQSYIENILRLNKGRKVNAYVSFPDSNQWRDKVFTGLIEEAGKDHLIIKDVTNGNWYLIRILYLDYVEFMEPINYLHIYSEKTF